MKIKQIIAAVISSAIALSSSAFAQTQFVNITGYADPDDIGITALMLDKGTKLDEITNDDILWVNQADINEYGVFSIRVPVLTEGTYDFYSNADSYEVSQPVTLYVSSEGNDENDGKTQEAPLKTLKAAYGKYPQVGEIILLDNFVYENAPAAYEGELKITGINENVELTLNGTVSLRGNLTFDSLKIIGAQSIVANGFELVMGSKITTDSRLTVYGGKNGADLVGDTNVTLLGGKYQAIYGGGKGAKVTGNTNVIVGGNVNNGDSIDDGSSAKSPCYVYGGGNNGEVTGKTNVTLQDSAVTLYIIGAGSGAKGTAKDTNIFINGGQVMNVYGGSTSATALPDGTVTNITMTGGKAEALFGGCERAGFTGHTFVNVLGGEVSRRIYTGSYNDVDFGMEGLSVKATWKSSHHISGTTTLTIGPDARLNTKSGLSGDNDVNVGVFAGSRMESKNTDEVNTIIYLDDSYSSHKGYIGEKSTYIIVSLSNWMKSFEDYYVKAGKNGTVYGTTTAGIVRVEPDEGYYGLVNGSKCETENVAVSNGASITFEKDAAPVVDFKINDLQASKEQIDENTSNISADVSFEANNTSNRVGPRMYAAVYTEFGKDLLAIKSIDATPDITEHTFAFDYTFETQTTYMVKVIMWDAYGEPLESCYTFTVR